MISQQQPPEPQESQTTEHQEIYLTDVGFAKWFVRMHRENVRYVPAWKCWMVKEGDQWVPRNSDEMVRYVQLTINDIRAKGEALGIKNGGKELLVFAKKNGFGTKFP